MVGIVLGGRALLLLSTTLMVEYEAVLTRSDNLAAFGLEVADVLAVLDELAGLCVPVAFEYRWRPGAARPRRRSGAGNRDQRQRRHDGGRRPVRHPRRAPEGRSEEASRMSSFPLRIPDNLKKQAIAQAEAAGVSLNQYIATALASRVGAQAEAERYFAARGGRVVRGRAKEILARSGLGNPPREDYRLE